MRRGAWNGLIAATFLLGVAWIWVNRVPSAAQAGPLPAAPALGHPAPLLSLSGPAGQAVDLVALRGRPVVLNFWATWCPPCRSETPELARLSQRYAGQVVVIGVDQGEPAATVQAFMSEQGIGYPVALDQSGQASQAFAVHALPTTFFIDRAGVIRQIYIGPLSGPLLAQMLATVYP
jgi:cytochrome c biogenesis protein CcmG, thiol:disulfide interchange protein DsbE